MELRYYQREAVDAAWNYLTVHPAGDNPLVCMPTGSGKTPTLGVMAAEAVRDFGGRVGIVAHVKELLQQSAEKLQLICPKIPIGLYSASLRRKQTQQPILICGIQSVYKRADEVGPFDLLIVDECHLIPPDGDGMYQQFIRDLHVMTPHMRVVGLTATPYRMTTGLIYGPDNLFKEVCYEAQIRPLIAQGFLCPLISKRSLKIDFSGVHVRGGEFIERELEDVMMGVVKPAVDETLRLAAGRKSIIVFSSGIAHGQKICELLREAGEQVAFISGETNAGDRAEAIHKFKTGQIRFLVNVMVLTTGFDAPNVDCVVLLRATLSPGLYYQMCGRGFRIHPDKTDCLVLDFGGNVDRHGPVDMINPGRRMVLKGGGEAITKECPQCEALIAVAYLTCPHCGNEFPEREVKHDTEAGTSAILSTEDPDAGIEELDVMDVFYQMHVKRNSGPNAVPTMRVDYVINLLRTVSEWVCIEHDGFAQQKAMRWWKQRSKEPFPQSVSDAVELANEGFVGRPSKIRVRKRPESKWPEVINSLPDEIPDSQDELLTVEEIPF